MFSWLWMCRYGYFIKRRKTGKNEHESGMSVESQSLESKSQSWAYKFKRSLQSLINVLEWPLCEVWRKCKIGPYIFQSWQIQSLNDICEEKSTLALHLSRFGKISPWIIFWSWAEFILGVSLITLMVLVNLLHKAENPRPSPFLHKQSPNPTSNSPKPK